MLTITGPRYRLCENFSRRGFLKIGALSMGAWQLSLADILRAEQQSGTSAPHKGVINVFLGGGPPHQDMWDLKMEAPSEIRGEFQPIKTNVPGIDICEVFPRMAQLMDKSVLIRSVVGSEGRHDAFQCMTGWTTRDLVSLGGRPSVGATAAKLLGPVNPSVPPFVGLAAKTRHTPWSDSGKPGFLGAAFAPFKPDGPGMANMKLNGITLERLQSRRALLGNLDRLRRDIDADGSIAALDSNTQSAFNILTSSKLVEALDLSKESDKVRERYGDGKPYKFQYDGAPTCNEQFLMARRLIEAGARCVTLSYGRWDSHSKNFDLVRDHGSKLDQALSALIEDLDVRGMLDDVTVAVWGEFGRTPRVNKNAGRDHWPKVSGALLAGGGMRTGQVIGATNRLGEYAERRPVHFQEIIATLYRNLGIRTESTTITDPTGRPQFVSDVGPISEIV
ncbi:hypothetical protein Pan216_53350 [Planctomycetes bacterium Pan216]|uniref:DUF1501 domain-containing protein n=1 Tax=Kolteria novifilia TaxID=2527975 RepID=A0A518BBT7_9BACT|nr:hypothetical protein Pan216_53350 [Planctomycetes bacterium Pan216]